MDEALLQQAAAKAVEIQIAAKVTEALDRAIERCARLNLQESTERAHSPHNVPRPYIYRTLDGGASWTLLVDGIADGRTFNTVNVVREDPQRRGLLYCGTESGLYVSFDDGGHWQELQQGLPRTSVRDLQIHDSDLVIATHGRGFYIMDDIALLRSLPGAAGVDTQLFPPAPAYRVQSTTVILTPRPKEEPRGENPPAGAYIDYALPPGRYWVDLEAGGRHYKQPLTVLRDPRSHLSAAMYARKFELARAIERDRLEIVGAMADAARIHEQIAARRQTVTGPLATALAGADAQLLEISDLLPVLGPDAHHPAPTSVRGLRYLDAVFAKLAISVDGSDTALTTDAVQGYTKHKALLDKTLAQWMLFATSTLPALNTRLTESGLPPVNRQPENPR